MKLDERYMYTVVPRSPIRNLIKGKAIIKATNLQLSKDEVKECLKYGAVYRKFYCESNSERVTPSNLDRLHRKDHITEKQYEKLMSHESENSIPEEEDTDELLKNGEEEQSFTDNKSEETVPQSEDDSNDQESVEVESAETEEPAREETETQEDQTETQFTFDTAGDFIKKDDEEQLCTGESEDDSNDQESVEVESAETEEPAREETETQEEPKQLTQKEQAANTYNQRNNNGGKKSKNKNKQKSQSAENKNSTN